MATGLPALNVHVDSFFLLFFFSSSSFFSFFSFLLSIVPSLVQIREAYMYVPVRLCTFSDSLDRLDTYLICNARCHVNVQRVHVMTRFENEEIKTLN